MTEARLFSRHSIGTRIAALFMLLILVITAAMTYVSISVSTNELLDSSTEYTEQLIRRVGQRAPADGRGLPRSAGAAGRRTEDPLGDHGHRPDPGIRRRAVRKRGCVAQHLLQLPGRSLVPGRAAGAERGAGVVLARGKPDRGPVQLGRFVLQGRARPRREYAGRSAHRP